MYQFSSGRKVSKDFQKVQGAYTLASYLFMSVTVFQFLAIVTFEIREINFRIV